MFSRSCSACVCVVQTADHTAHLPPPLPLPAVLLLLWCRLYVYWLNIRVVVGKAHACWTGWAARVRPKNKFYVHIHALLKYSTASVPNRGGSAHKGASVSSLGGSHRILKSFEQWALKQQLFVIAYIHSFFFPTHQCEYWYFCYCISNSAKIGFISKRVLLGLCF